MQDARLRLVNDSFPIGALRQAEQSRIVDFDPYRPIRCLAAGLWTQQAVAVSIGMGTTLKTLAKRVHRGCEAFRRLSPALWLDDDQACQI